MDHWYAPNKTVVPEHELLPALFDSLTDTLNGTKAAIERNLSPPLGLTAVTMPLHTRREAQTVAQSAALRAGFRAPYLGGYHSMHTSIHLAYQLGDCHRYPREGCLDWGVHTILVVDYNDDGLGFYIDEHAHGVWKNDPSPGGVEIE